MNKHEIKGHLLDQMKESVIIIGHRTLEIGNNAYPLDLAENMADAAYAVLNQHISTVKKYNENTNENK